MGGIIAAIVSVLPSLFKTIDEVVPDKDLATKLKSEIQLKAMNLEQSRLDAARQIILAEINSQYWLQANWRPLVAVIFSLMLIANWGASIIQVIFGLPHPVTFDLPPTIETLILTMVGGYGFIRHQEKKEGLRSPVNLLSEDLRKS